MTASHANVRDRQRMPQAGREPEDTERPIFVYVPVGFEPREVLPERLRKRADDSRWFVHTVLIKSAFGDTDESGNVRLHSDVLRRVMSKRDEPGVVRVLAEGGVIFPPAPYSAGRMSKGYRLTPIMQSMRCAAVEVRDRKLEERIKRERKRWQEEQKQVRSPIHNQLAETQRDLTILEAAETVLNRLPTDSLLCQHVLVQRIRRRDFRFTVSSTGRCFNAMTGLKRTLRPFLRLAGELIGGVDIRCAQPALLVSMIHLFAGENVPTYISTRAGSLLLSLPTTRRLAGLVGSWNEGDDLERFEYLVCHSDLYKQLIVDCRAAGVKLPNDDTEARDYVKYLFMRDVLAKKGRYFSEFEMVFRQAYPSVHEFIGLFNQEDHGELIRALQRFESWFVIENVAPRLVRRFPIVTLHDAIYARTRDLPVVEKVFIETARELGLRLRVKRERAGSPDTSDRCDPREPSLAV